jgi:hypothetical protein
MPRQLRKNMKPCFVVTSVSRIRLRLNPVSEGLHLLLRTKGFTKWKMVSGRLLHVTNSKYSVTWWKMAPWGRFNMNNCATMCDYHDHAMTPCALSSSHPHYLPTISMIGHMKYVLDYVTLCVDFYIMRQFILHYALSRKVFTLCVGFYIMRCNSPLNFLLNHSVKPSCFQQSVSMEPLQFKFLTSNTCLHTNLSAKPIAKPLHRL